MPTATRDDERGAGPVAVDPAAGDRRHNGAEQVGDENPAECSGRQIERRAAR